MNQNLSNITSPLPKTANRWTIFRGQIYLVPFDILVLIFVSQSMLPAWAALLLALVNFGTWWCYYRIPHFLRTVSGPTGDNILIPGPIVEYFARFIQSCGVHHRAHYGLMLAMMAGFHAAMAGYLFSMQITPHTGMLLGWVAYTALLAVDFNMFWVSLRTLHKLQEDQLVEANIYTNELKRSNEDLEQFAYIASHDLRAPLRAMKNLTEWISDDVKDTCSEETKQNLTLLDGRVDRLDRLLNNLLQYSRLGREQSRQEYIPLAQKIQTAFDLLNADDIHSIDLTGGEIWVHDHDVTFEILILNLLGNAIKHNDKDIGQLWVNLESVKDGLNLSIDDNGPGIPEESVDKIFNAFATLQRRDEVEASGMGLAIVKKIVLNKNGTISVTRSPHGGARFSIFLPIETYANPPHRIAA